MYGECDHCHEFRAISSKTRFCRECLMEWRRVDEKYFDGDFLGTLLQTLEYEVRRGGLRER
jgi:hypothetical protein